MGFEDVTGARADTEEDFEASEQAATSDLAMRIASAVVIFGLFLGSLLLGGWWFAAFVILAMIVSAGELYATARSEDGRPLALFGLLGVVFMGVGAQMTGAAAIAGWAAAFSVVTILFLTLSPRRKPLEDASVTISGMGWVGLLSFAILIAQGPHPVAYILFVVLLVAANDTGAYFVGRAFGRRKLSPLISPKKTLEGLVGGLIAGLVVASILATFPAWETIGIAKALVAGAVVGLIAPLGDAVESMVKRSMGVKDMGSVLPATVGCSTGSMASSSRSRPSTSCSAGSVCCDPPGGRSRGDRVHRVPDNRGGHLARPGRRRPCRPIPIGEAGRAGDRPPHGAGHGGWRLVRGARGIRAPGRATGRVRRRGGHRRSTDPGTIVVNGIVGAAGLRATLAGLECGKSRRPGEQGEPRGRGPVVKRALAEHGGELIPVDSEHSALLQCLAGEDAESVSRLILTARRTVPGAIPRLAGRGHSRRGAGPPDVGHGPADNHRLGHAVQQRTRGDRGSSSVRRRLRPDRGADPPPVDPPLGSRVRRRVLERPSGSSRHEDPDPVRIDLSGSGPIPGRPFDLAGMGLTFEAPDPVSFPALDLAFEAGREGGSSPAVLNAADEVAVAAFLDGRLGFLGIAEVVSATLETADWRSLDSVGDVIAADREGRRLPPLSSPEPADYRRFAGSVSTCSEASLRPQPSFSLSPPTRQGTSSRQRRPG